MEEGYLALRWNNHNTIFTKILNLLREQESYTDVSLACSGRMFAAHKFVLSTCSDYFKEMFSNNPCKHPIVFMKDVTSRDIESLLDFMYKGEVHVPQSELGSLLRTAEALQVKGLAVPDDTTQPSSVMESPNSFHFSPSVPSGHSPGVSKPPRTLLNSSLPVKRKRASESSKKDEPPKLTPSQNLFAHKSPAFRTTKAAKNRVSSMPELKRFKLGVDEVKLMRINNNNNSNNNNNNSTHIAEEAPPEANENVSDTPLGILKEENGLIPLKNIKEEIETKLDDDQEENFDPENGEHEVERNSLGEEEGEEEMEEEEEEEEEEEGPEENSSPILPSEGDENSSLPNSEISTPNLITTPFLQAELLQVDLSEDGTQFIIGPGVVGGEASRASSTAEEEGTEGAKKPFVCLLCGHTFTRRDNLANHLKTHTGDRPYMCQYCHKCFSRKDYLKQHERIHTGEKPYACEICGRAFTRKEGLTDHMRCHSDFKAFACETCGKSFKQKCGLRFHKRNYRH